MVSTRSKMVGAKEAGPETQENTRKNGGRGGVGLNTVFKTFFANQHLMTIVVVRWSTIVVRRTFVQYSVYETF